MTFLVSLMNQPAAAVVLDFMNSAIQYAILASLLCEINGKRVNLPRVILHAALMLAMINIPRLIYLISWHAAWILDNPWISGLLYGFFEYPNPVWLTLCCIATVAVLKLPWQNIKGQLVVIFCGYLLLDCLKSLLTSIIWLGIVDGILHMRYEPGTFLARYVYLFREACSVLPTLIVIAGQHLLRRYIVGNRHKIKVFAEKEDGRQARPGWIYAQVLILWAIVLGLGLVDEAGGDATQVAVHFGYLLALMFIAILAIYLDYSLKVKDTESKNHADSVRSMLDTINNFRGIKHDFNNILQTYDGYFELEDFEGLRNYHQVLRRKTVSAGDRLTLQTTFVHKPAILGLITSTSEYAEKMGVDFALFHGELLGRIAMAEFDLCRVLGIMLNNAIEHAAGTAARSVSLSIQAKTEQRGIVFIANSVDGRINTADIFKEGYTTKEGHSGHGLAEANKILAGYYGCTLLPSCTEDTFTIYLNVPLEAASLEETANMSGRAL